MASGNTLCVFTPLHHQPRATAFAQLGLRNNHPTLEFDASTAWAAIFGAVLPRHYSGLGVTIKLYWMAASAITGDVKWITDFERIADSGGHDLDLDDFATVDQQTVTTTVPGTSGVITTSALAHSNTQIDGLLAGEAFRLRITRDAAHVADTAAGNAQIIRVEIKET